MLLQRNREYSLSIGDWKSGDGLLIQNLQVTFDVSKSANNKDKTNSAAIEIYNLSDESLRVLDTDYPFASFSVGYRDIGLKQLFAGQVYLVTTRKSGTDRITQLRMGSGYTDLNHTLLNQLTSPGRDVKAVLEDIRKNLPGVSRGVYNGTNLNNQVLYGYPLIGTPKQMLNELSEKYQLDWQVDDDVLYVHDKDRANDENFDQAYVVSRYAGLIENAYRVTSDERRSKKDKVKKQGVQWRMLLNPDIVAGSIVKLEDTLIQGWYKVDDVRHFGGWRDNDWFTEVKASAIEKVVSTK